MNSHLFASKIDFFFGLLFAEERDTTAQQRQYDPKSHKTLLKNEGMLRRLNQARQLIFDSLISV
jgi:hypothetical protein